MKKILLTGASGFIGQHAIPFLLKKGYEVHAVDISKKPSHIIRNRKLFWHECDLLNYKQQKILFKEIKPTHLLHFAWYAVPGKYWISFENIKWVQASLELVINFHELGGKRAVFAGTCAEYDWNYGYCSEGITPTRPRTLYGNCKNSLQEILSQFSKQTGISIVWGRIFFLYGPYEAKNRLVPFIITSLLQDHPAQCTHGDQIRDFLHVEDVASAFVSLLQSNVEGPVNIASGQPVALKTIIYTIADLLGKRHLVQLGVLPAPENEPHFLIADVRKLNQQVGWKPKITLEAGLKSTIEWWKQNLKGNKL
ncbi:MAG: NAD(P)-dependent oxidoreductase [Thermodesulfovibrionales bacterium]|nr:NAD(P)-dependent oxidoreductase [Thermodesulfovibrionales bacterium]